MPTFEEIKTAMENAVRYRGAETDIDKQAADANDHIWAGVVTALGAEMNIGKVEQFLPTVDATTRKIGEYLAFDTRFEGIRYSSAVKVTCGELSIPIVYHLRVSKDDGETPGEDRQWGIFIDKDGSPEADPNDLGDNAKLGPNFGPKVSNEGVAKLITDIAMQRFVWRAPKP